jgi:hypothetical protein
MKRYYVTNMYPLIVAIASVFNARVSHAFVSLIATSKLPNLSTDLHRCIALVDRSCRHDGLWALSDAYLENDLVSVKVPSRLMVQQSSGDDDNSNEECRRFCVVRQDATVVPLCRHEDDVETDLFIDPRTLDDKFWQQVTDDAIEKTYGEGWYGQRPVPS